MVRRKSTCGLCKPHKKWKKNNTKAQQDLKREINRDIVSAISTL